MLLGRINAPFLILTAAWVEYQRVTLGGLAHRILLVMWAMMELDFLKLVVWLTFSQLKHPPLSVLSLIVTVF